MANTPYLATHRLPPLEVCKVAVLLAVIWVLAAELTLPVLVLLLVRLWVRSLTVLQCSSWPADTGTRSYHTSAPVLCLAPPATPTVLCKVAALLGCLVAVALAEPRLADVTAGVAAAAAAVKDAVYGHNRFQLLLWPKTHSAGTDVFVKSQSPMHDPRALVSYSLQRCIQRCATHYARLSHV